MAFLNKQGVLDYIENTFSNTTDKGEFFCKYLISEYFPNLIYQYGDGPGDGGIDCIASETEDILIIFQSKYGSSYTDPGTISAEYDKIIDHLPDSSYLDRSGFYAGLREFIKTPEVRVKFYFITTNSLDQAGLERLKTYQERLTQVLGCECIVQNISLDDIFNKPTINLDFKLKGKFIIQDNIGTGIVNTYDLYKFMEDYRSKTGNIELLFDKNLRHFLNNTNKVNKGIALTLSSSPEKFFERNNGIRILSEGNLVIDENGDLTLHNPSIPNGCQSGSEIDLFFSISKSIPAISSFINVTLVNIKGRSAEDVDGISRYTNTQSAVKQKNYWCFDQRIKDLKKRVEGMGYYLEIKQNELSKRYGLSRLDVREKSLDVSGLLMGYYVTNLKPHRILTSGRYKYPGELQAEKAVTSLGSCSDIELKNYFEAGLFYKTSSSTASRGALTVLFYLISSTKYSFSELTEAQRNYLWKSSEKLWKKYTDPATIAKRAYKDFPEAMDKSKGLGECFDISKALALIDLIIDFIDDDLDRMILPKKK